MTLVDRFLHDVMEVASRQSTMRLVIDDIFSMKRAIPPFGHSYFTTCDSMDIIVTDTYKKDEQVGDHMYLCELYLMKELFYNQLLYPQLRKLQIYCHKS